ncbi:MAG: SAM-dependent methyltransferase, partial [Gammaproteobacteria bacterium]|nr:SAM-dependent methyltransferase [Gammaproteobacteria bacterium]
MVKTEDFDKNALEYDRWFERHKIEYAQELKALRELLPKEGLGVEIGAGTGRFSQPLGISLGVEPSKAMRSI